MLEWIEKEVEKVLETNEPSKLYVTTAGFIYRAAIVKVSMRNVELLVLSPTTGWTETSKSLEDNADYLVSTWEEACTRLKSALEAAELKDTRDLVYKPSFSPPPAIEEPQEPDL